MNLPSDIPKLFKHVPSRVTPLEEINYKDEIYFKRFVDRWLEIETEGSKLKKLISYYRDLHFLYIDVALIISRINEDASKINRSEEIWDIIHRGERKLRQSEANELDRLRIFINYLILDVKSLFINILIFMDQLAKFLSLFIEARGLKNRSFYKFRKALKKKRGKEIEELRHLVSDNTIWFEKVKDIRDDFVEHHPGASGMIGFHDGKAHATLVTTKTGDRIFRDISIEEISDILQKFKEFLKNLDQFLESHIKVLPIKAE